MPLTEVFEGRDATQVVELAGGKRQQSYHNVRGGSGRVRALMPRSFGACFASASQPLAPLFLQRIFGATTRREKADRRLIIRSDTAPMQCRSETVQNSALASLG